MCVCRVCEERQVKNTWRLWFESHQPRGEGRRGPHWLSTKHSKLGTESRIVPVQIWNFNSPVGGVTDKNHFFFFTLFFLLLLFVGVLVMKLGRRRVYLPQSPIVCNRTRVSESCQLSSHRRNGNKHNINDRLADSRGVRCNQLRNHSSYACHGGPQSH